MAGNHGSIQWEARAYHTDIDNLIAFGTDIISPTVSVSLPKNVNKAQVDGLEVEINAQLLGWNSKLSMNLLNPIDRANHARLLRRYQKSLNFDLSRSFGQFDVGATEYWRKVIGTIPILATLRTKKSAVTSLLAYVALITSIKIGR